MQIDQLIRSKRRSISIEIAPGGKVLVRAPLFATDGMIRSVMEKRAEWIRTTRARMMKLAPAPQARRFASGEQHYFLGKQYPLNVVSKSSSSLKFDEKTGFTLSAADRSEALELFIAWYRKQTRTFVSSLINDYIKRYHFQVNDLRITSARTRWGSCSGKNTISFTYRLIMAPPEVVEYVVVHELVHTQIKNHSAQFWAAVAAIRPGYKKERAHLKTNGLAYTLE